MDKDVTPVQSAGFFRGLSICFGAWTLLAGCATAPVSPSSWEPPAWMAEQQQAQEEMVGRLQGCMDAIGWDITVEDASGAIVEPFESRSELERVGADIEACFEAQRVDLTVMDGTITVDQLRLMYEYDVDTYDCLVAQGVNLRGEPPGEDIYVEQGLATDATRGIGEVWAPYLDPEILSMAESDVRALQEVCIERGPFLVTP